MSKNWHQTETDLEAEKHSSDFWLRHSEELQKGEFWADRIKEMRGEPVARLALALENLPLPASFREAAIATRALIREKRKQKSDYDEELALLYWLAAINSFSIPYSEVLQEPGFNVIESIPGKKLKGLPFTYQTLGYEKLNLLNKTDIKWIVERWGDPEKHTTLHEMHTKVWSEYETKLKDKRANRYQETVNRINELESTDDTPSQPNNSTKGSSKIKWVIALVLLLLIVGAVAGR